MSLPSPLVKAGICDWSVFGACIPTLSPSIKCNVNGCITIVHHVCQGLWEASPNGTKASGSMYCHAHHPCYDATKDDPDAILLGAESTKNEASFHEMVSSPANTTTAVAAASSSFKSLQEPSSEASIRHLARFWGCSMEASLMIEFKKTWTCQHGSMNFCEIRNSLVMV